MNSRTFVPPIRPAKAPRHEAGSTPRHLIPCRYFARGYCSRGDSCLFSHSFNDPAQLQGLQGNHHTIVPFWNNYSSFSPQPYARRHPEIRRSSVPQVIAVPPSPSSSSVATPDEAVPIFNFRSSNGSSPEPSTLVSDIMKASSTLVPSTTQTSISANGDTSCDEFSTTRSDVTRDEFLSPAADVYHAEFYSISPHSPVTPVPYVQRGFGYRDERARSRDNRRRRVRVKPAHRQREGSGASPTYVLQGVDPRKSSFTSDSDGAPGKSQPENWRVIGGGVMLGTPTSATSRRKLKRLQSCSRVAEEDRLDGSYDESLNSSLPTDESFEFSDLVASVKFTINQPPMADIIARPKSSLSTAKASPLTALFTHAEVA